MEEAHSGVYGAHQVKPKLYVGIKRMGYYWPALVQRGAKPVSSMLISFIKPRNDFIRLRHIDHLKLGDSTLWALSI